MSSPHEYTPIVMPTVPSSIVTRAASFFVAALSAATRTRFLYTSLLCLLWSGTEIASHAAQYSQGLSWSTAVNAVLSMQLNGCAVMLALLAADRASESPLNRWWPYPLAVIAGVAVGTILLWLVSQCLLGLATAFHEEGSPEPVTTFMFRHGIHGLMICGLATVGYVLWRRANQRQAALRAMQIDRARVEKQVLNLRLAALQARVEPRFLLDALGRVERQFETDSRVGFGMLNDLVAYLRVAIPQIRESGSTIGREVELVNAYLRVTNPTNDRVLRRAADSSLADDARVPPMLMLPLITRALAQRSECAPADNWFEIGTMVNNDILALRLRDSSDGFIPSPSGDERDSQLRERLAALYGSQASLTMRACAHGSEAVIEIPYET